ncbi:MAG: flippase activity-associated protein Agl23, partial [Planctomycetota bacterium]
MQTRQTTYWILLFVIVLGGGIFFRLWQLGERPMHTDEAVHAIKYEALLEKGLYFYDPHEFHGPTLNYATLISSVLRGESNSAAISEVTLRCVPAVFGIALIFTPLLFAGNLNKRTVFFSCLLLAFSPAFVYYSRYYIQETLLVFFTATFLGCAWRYAQSKRCTWLILSGISIGLMHATKETFVFSLAAAFTALIVYMRHEKLNGSWKVSHLLGAAVAMVLTSVLFFSSFGQNWQGILDSVATYAIWFQRSGDSIHVHPWYFYLDLITWIEILEPVTWNEDGIVALAFCGLLFIFIPKARTASVPIVIRCIAAYTLTLTAIYCIIPYKTPWCMLSFLYGMVILGAFTLNELTRTADSRWQKTCIGIIIAVFVCISPVFQSWMLNFKYHADPRNPYVYAHTSTDIFPMLEAIEKAADAAEGKKTLIYAIADEHDHWPLPWYLRLYENDGYPLGPEAYVCRAPIIIANAEQEQALLNVLYTAPPPGQKHLYVPLFDEDLYLRPGVPWRGYIRKDLYDRMNAAGESALPSPTTKESSAMSQPDKNKIENLLKFSHQAMHTDFRIFIQDERGTYAGRAARAAFHEVDRLEQLLSRFIPNSDVSRVNKLSAGEEAVVDKDVMLCLQDAQKAYELTGGAFDMTIGAVIQAWKNDEPEKAKQLLSQSTGDKLELDAELLIVKLLADDVSIDLGGIGKGYAVDVIAKVLDEWGIERAMIHGGASSVRALNAPQDKPGWDVTISDPVQGNVIDHLNLANEVLSCSGIGQGQHIINP